MFHRTLLDEELSSPFSLADWLNNPLSQVMSPSLTSKSAASTLRSTYLRARDSAARVSAFPISVSGSQAHSSVERSMRDTDPFSSMEKAVRDVEPFSMFERLFSKGKRNRESESVKLSPTGKI